MEREFATDATLTLAEENPLVEATSSEYLGRWNHLVSTTNWEKGRIICEWRAALEAGGAPAASFTDEAWSRRVGNVTPQHTGRLRRVFQRFGETRQQYAGLFWSHFQAALDWNDAEMWLEGAVQNDWSISIMGSERARTLGELAGPPVDESPSEELDDDAVVRNTSSLPESVAVSEAEVFDHGMDDAAQDDSAAADEAPFEATDSYADAPLPPAPAPFKHLPSLPADVADAFEAMKLAILHHRIARWQEVSCDDLVMAIESLRQLALAPSEE